MTPDSGTARRQPPGSWTASILGMDLLETPIGAAAPVVAVAIMVMILALGALGWWLGAGRRGSGER